MKVGIVTEPLVDNYGGVLQNYALQQSLRRIGLESVTLNYLSSLPLGRYLLYFGKNLLFQPFKSRRKKIKPYRKFIQRPEAFDKFISDHIAATLPVTRYSGKLISKYGIEALVVGSDQVWRRQYNEHLDDMYLAFAKSYDMPKIAYAASIGVDKWDYTPEQTELACDLIKGFSAVSVREESAISLCRENLGVKPELVLDPTLLLDATDYEALCQEVPVGKEPYLAAYVLDINDEKRNTIDSIAKQNGLNVKFVTVSSESKCSVEEWLAMFRDASFVITDSFHGTVFSILFGKRFRIFVNKERGADRFYSLFKQLGIDANATDKIDYEAVNAILKQRRDESIEYLIQWLK